MFQGLKVSLVIPARNEAQSLPAVLASVPSCVDVVVVCDNGSSDGTGDVAKAAGAQVIVEERPGYGAACLAAIAVLRAQRPLPDILVFADADGSDDLSEMERLLQPITTDGAELVIGSRIARAAPKALTFVQRFGNQFAGLLVYWIWGQRVGDLGPFRAIRWEAYERLAMQDRDFGWTIEMQVKAAQAGLKVVDVDVNYRVRRAGKSKIAGTITGSLRAGTKILWVIARSALRDWTSGRAAPKTPA